MLSLSLVRGSSANQGAAIFCPLIEMSGLLGEFYTELYRAVHRALSVIRHNGVSAFQGDAYTGRIGPIVGTLESVRIIEVSAFQGCPQGGIPLYVERSSSLAFNCSLLPSFSYSFTEACYYINMGVVFCQ